MPLPPRLKRWLPLPLPRPLSRGDAGRPALPGGCGGGDADRWRELPPAAKLASVWLRLKGEPARVAIF